MNVSCSTFPHPGGKHRHNTVCALALLALGGMLPDAHAALAVDINTSALAGANARLDFYLLDGDGAENNSATIAGFMLDGLPLAGAPASTTINDTGGFGQFTHDVTLGSTLHFTWDFSGNYAGGDADRLVLGLLDASTNFTLVTTDLNLADALAVNDALLTVDYTGANPLIRIASLTTPAVTVSAVPLPAPWLLMSSFLAPCLSWMGLRRKPQSTASL